MRAAALLPRGAPTSAQAEQNRVRAGVAGRWLGAAVGTAVERADSHPPTMSAMHTAAAWLRYRGASAAAHGPSAIPGWEGGWCCAPRSGFYFTSAFSMALQAQARFYGI